MKTIKWNTKPLKTQRSQQSTNKAEVYNKYSPSRQKNILKKQSQLLQIARPRAQPSFSIQTNIDSIEKLFINNISSGKKIKAKFPLRQMSKHQQKGKYKNYIHAILCQIKNIINELTGVFHDFKDTVEQFQKNFQIEISKTIQSLLNIKKEDINMPQLDCFNIKDKNQATQSYSHINHKQQPQTVKKFSYFSQRPSLQTQQILVKTKDNCFLQTQTTEYPNQIKLIQSKKSVEQTYKQCKMKKNHNSLTCYNNSPDYRKNSISVQINKIKGALGKMKGMLHTK